MAVSTGCGLRIVDYTETARSANSPLPWPKQMELLFGEGDHFIPHHGVLMGARTWYSESHFGGRYLLTMEVDVAVDIFGNVVVKRGAKPEFFLAEIFPYLSENGEITGMATGDSWSFDEAQWKKVVNAGGGWSEIGISVKEDSPVPGFDRYVAGKRAARVYFR